MSKVKGVSPDHPPPLISTSPLVPTLHFVPLCLCAFVPGVPFCLPCLCACRAAPPLDPLCPLHAPLPRSHQAPLQLLLGPSWAVLCSEGTGKGGAGGAGASHACTVPRLLGLCKFNAPPTEDAEVGLQGEGACRTAGGGGC